MKNGKRHGRGVQYCDDNELVLYEGEFKEGYYGGEGTLYHYGSGIQCNGIVFTYYYKGTYCK